MNSNDPNKTNGIRHFKRWTIDELTDLVTAINLHQNSNVIPWEEIANDFGRSVHTIHKRAFKLGLYRGTDAKYNRTLRVIVWEDEEVEFLKLAWNEGMSTKDIQDNLRKTKRAVLSKVALLNLAKRRIGLDVSKTAIDEYEAGYKSDEVAKSAGVNNQTFRNLIKRHTPRRELSNRDIETISDRHEDGCSASCIAQRIQRSTLIVKDFIKKAQLDIDSIPTDKLVLSLESDGFTTAQIAMKLELPLVAITNAYKRLRGKGKQNV